MPCCAITFPRIHSRAVDNGGFGSYNGVIHPHAGDDLWTTRLSAAEQVLELLLQGVGTQVRGAGQE